MSSDSNYNEAVSTGIMKSWISGTVIENFEANNLTVKTGTETPATVTAPDGGWVEGENTFSVSCESACYAVYSNDGGLTYTRLAATKNADGSYSYTVDVDSSTLLVTGLNGDVNGDGKVQYFDSYRIKLAFAGKITLSPLEAAAADVNNDGEIKYVDSYRVKLAFAGKKALDW